MLYGDMKARLCVGVTGHRQDDPLFGQKREQIVAAVAHVFRLIDRAITEDAAEPGVEIAPVRMHGLLADGTDQLAAQLALDLGWELVAPLPFGLGLAAAISAQPCNEAEARALLEEGEGQGPAIRPEARPRVQQLRQLAAHARLFELADSDQKIIQLLLAWLADPQDQRKAAVYDAEISLRAVMASRVVVEQSDFLVAVWDGVTRAAVGGTGHTIQVALEAGAAVVWIDANEPSRWRFLAGPEALADVGTCTAPMDDGELIARLRELVRVALHPVVPHRRGQSPDDESRPGGQVPGAVGRARRGGPEAIAMENAARLLAAARALPGQDARHLAAIEVQVLQRFAWLDGLSATLADAYRLAMMVRYLLAAVAVAGAAAWGLGLGAACAWAWGASALAALSAAMALAAVARRRRWYWRWRETRRMAEYLRQAILPLLLGVARPAGCWPVGMHTSWPEWHARHVLREPGLPRLVVTPAYLEQAVRLLQRHVGIQLDYYQAKARRMASVCRQLDRLCGLLLALALCSLTACLLVDQQVLPGFATAGRWLLFSGIVLPAFAAALAAIRHFGDFERLAEISSVTARKLDAIGRRAGRLLAAQDGELDYGRVAQLAHALEQVVVSDIEGWQPVFGGSDIMLPP